MGNEPDPMPRDTAILRNQGASWDRSPTPLGKEGLMWGEVECKCGAIWRSDRNYYKKTDHLPAPEFVFGGWLLTYACPKCKPTTWKRTKVSKVNWRYYPAEFRILKEGVIVE